MQVGKGQDWGSLVPKDRLNERYDNVTVPESPGKSQISEKRDQREGSAGVGDQCLSDLGQWSHYLPNVRGNLPGK